MWEQVRSLLSLFFIASSVTVVVASSVTVVITDVIVIANVIPLGLPGKRGRSQGVLGILSVTF